MRMVTGKLSFLIMQQRTISTTSNLNSSYDSLTLYDGDSNSAPIIGEYCGNSIPNNQISSTNSVLIHFESDGGVTEPGFQLECHQYST